MSATKATLGTYLGNLVVQDPAAAAVGQDNVTGAASTVYHLEVDNTANAGTPVYFKFFDLADPTIGTSAPQHTFYVPGDAVGVFTCADGWVFGVAVSYACVTGREVASTAAPSASVPVKIIAA